MKNIESAFQAAVAVPGAASIVRIAHDAYQKTRGPLADAQVQAGIYSPARALEVRQIMDRSHMAFLESEIEASPEKLRVMLHPELSPAALAANRCAQVEAAIQDAQRQGVRLAAVVGGGLEATPAAKVTAGLADSLARFASEIWHLLRAEIRTFNTDAAPA